MLLSDWKNNRTMNTKIMKVGLMTIVLCMLMIPMVSAQHTFSGKVTDENNVQLPGAQVVLSIGDSIYAAALTDANGAFSIRQIKTGTYDLSISFFGYTSLEEKRTINKSQRFVFSLVPEMSVELEKVEITGNRGDLVKRTATGQIFYLSEKAKNSGNPFLALREIPRLISNDALQSVKMEDGTQPLVLINGIAVNSGIAPIDPKDIESVEVVDVVDARYLRTGAKHILNIKLKKKIEPYRYFEVMNRYDLPDKQEMSALYFEVGNEKYSLYGRGAFDKTWHKDSDMDLFQQGDTYQKRSLSSTLGNSRSFIGELLFKWKATPKDYFAFHVYGRNRMSGLDSEGNGFLETDLSQSFSFASANKDKSNIYTGSLYHKHSFTDKKTLETTLAVNENQNKNKGLRMESYPDWEYHNRYLYDNNRLSATLNLDYSWKIDSKNSLNIGSETLFLNDHIDQTLDVAPKFHHREWNEYLYASYVGRWKKFNYMLSLGVEGIWLKAGNESANYVRPRLSGGLTYVLNHLQSLRLNYTLTNEAPDVNQLNPYNVSTDSLVRNIGNPGLTPMQIQSLGLTYTLNYKWLYFSPNIKGSLKTDAIEPYGYSQNDIYVNTYRNSGKFGDLYLGGSVNARLGNWGNMYANAYHGVNYFEGVDARKFFGINAGFTASYKKWMLVGDVNYQNYSYTSISRTRYHAPDYSSVQINYTILPGFYVAVALQYLNSPLHTTTLTVGDSYHSISSVKQKDYSFRPWILVRYTLRKNAKRKIQLDNVVKSREKGIELQKVD